MHTIYVTLGNFSVKDGIFRKPKTIPVGVWKLFDRSAVGYKKVGCGGIVCKNSAER